MFPSSLKDRTHTVSHMWRRPVKPVKPAPSMYDCCRTGAMQPPIIQVQMHTTDSQQRSRKQNTLVHVHTRENCHTCVCAGVRRGWWTGEGGAGGGGAGDACVVKGAFKRFFMNLYS